jgi:tRNA modification GTPase
MSGATIYALASAPQPAAIAVVRLSGHTVPELLKAMVVGGRLPAPRQATLCRLQHPISKQLLDQALVLYFPAPHSYTGEAVAELHLHGGRAVVQAVLACLEQQADCRLAEPGEFTKRAFLNDKMDLLAAEAIADLTAAETEQQRRQALAQSIGGGADAGDMLSQRIRDWSQRLLHSLAYVEAALDFPDEDLPQDLVDSARPAVAALQLEMMNLLQQSALSQEMREGFRIALVGAPNVGKSSLLNQLAGRPAAIVSAQAGTTRDVIEVRLNLGGYLVILADTAGVRRGGKQVEAEGIRRTTAWAQEAALRLLVTAPDQELPKSLIALRQSQDLLLVNKSDLLADAAPVDKAGLRVSAKTGEGLSDLLEALQKILQQRYDQAPSLLLSRQRQRLLVTSAADHLQAALKALTAELLAEEMRLALRCLGQLVGKFDVEQLLDVIFRDFCLGK